MTEDCGVVRAAVWEEGLSAAERAALGPGVPAELNRRPDVLVVGGGVIGLATAVACRLAGLGSVVVVERAERLASAASGGNGGAIAPDMHALTDSAEFVAFGRASLALYGVSTMSGTARSGFAPHAGCRCFPPVGGRLHCRRGRSSSGSTVRPCESWSPI